MDFYPSETVGPNKLFLLKVVFLQVFCQSMVTENFSGYSSLGWHPWSLNVCITLDQDLLAFIASIEKSGVILTGMSLYVTWDFSFAALNSFFSLFCMFSVLIIMWQGDFC